MRAPWMMLGLIALASAHAIAQIRPIPGPGDPRLQTAIYDANQIIQLQVAVGYQLTVELAADETAECFCTAFRDVMYNGGARVVTACDARQDAIDKGNAQSAAD